MIASAIHRVRADDHRRLLLQARGLHAVEHARQNRLRRPRDLIARALQRFAEAEHQADVRILLHEFRDGLARVIGDERRRRGKLRRDAVRFGERFGDENVVEHLHEPDAALVAFLREPAELLLIFLENIVRHFDRVGIILEPHERRERMAVPEIQRVHAVRREEIEILAPELLVVEPREQFRRVGILVNFSARQDERLLHPDARAAQGHRGLVVKVRDVSRQFSRPRESVSPIPDSRKARRNRPRLK